MVKKAKKPNKIQELKRHIRSLEAVIEQRNRQIQSETQLRLTANNENNKLNALLRTAFPQYDMPQSEIGTAVVARIKQLEGQNNGLNVTIAAMQENESRRSGNWTPREVRGPF